MRLEGSCIVVLEPEAEEEAALATSLGGVGSIVGMSAQSEWQYYNLLYWRTARATATIGKWTGASTKKRELMRTADHAHVHVFL